MLFLVVSVLAILPAFVQPAPVIQLPSGRVQGTDKLAQASKKPYITFYGIPFAKPPVNELRLKPPQPFVGTGPDVVISSHDFRPACLQVFTAYNKSMNEDCLYLNIFTPPVAAKPRKVMVWIHGGAFQSGDATQYIPSQLVTDKDVIVVTTQYRLGLFGFLTSESGDGNNGLRDQILAIKWTKDNIHAFGGDPNDITIFGESAGSVSVSLLSLSPLTKDLFTKAIMQSGTAMDGWDFNRNPSLIFNSVADKLGCSASPTLLSKNNSLDKMSCIRKKTVSELMSVNTPVHTVADKINTNIQFLPTIDGEVIPMSPELLLSNATYLEVNGVLDRDYIAGFTNNEGLIIFSPLFSTPLTYNFTAPESAEEYIEMVSRLLSPASPIDPSKLELLYYQYSYPRDENGHTSLQNLLDITADAVFVIPTIQFVRAVTKASNSTNIYLYLFDHYPQLTDPDGPLRGSTHGFDLRYEFDMGEISLAAPYAQPPQPSEKNLNELLLTALSQFAKTGSPVAALGQEPKIWPRYDRKDEYFFRISLTPKMDQHVHAKRVALWMDIVLKDSSSDPNLSRV